MYLGALPAQLRHVKTVRPPMQDMWVGSRLSRERFEVLIVKGRRMVDDRGVWSTVADGIKAQIFYPKR